ncbi:MAG: ATP-binding protein [Raoultibacter sp.]|jgi:hypothetical protein
MDKSLASFVEEVCGDSHLRVEQDLGDGFVVLRSSEAERRQAKHDVRCSEDIIIEMLRNSRDAGARNIFVALSREGSIRRICVIDDGAGIPETLHERVFEPRITSKLNTMHVDKWGVHGRGMALFSIKENSQQARVIESSPENGSSIFVEVNLDSLGEKTDQSSMPVCMLDDEEGLIIRGPHNINRTIAEFAYESKELCHVYYGSPSDIVAGLFLFGQSSLTKTERAFCDKAQDLALTKRLAIAADASELRQLAEDIGLSISERSARRVIDGDIKAPPEVYEALMSAIQRPNERRHAKATDIGKTLIKDRRGLKIHSDDLEAFTTQIKQAYQELAEKYYLEDSVEPEVRVLGNRIEIQIDFDKIR